MERNWNTNDFMGDASPELTEIINSCQTPTELRERMADYYARKGLAVRDPQTDGIKILAQDPDAHQFSRIVTLPDGRRTMITGGRSEAELDAYEAALLKSYQR
jgi:hypothetical protein